MKTSSSPLNRTLSRRTFLRQTTAAGAVLAVPIIAPASVFGADGTVAPSNRVALGFIGTGRQAVYANIPGFLHEPDAQGVAVCDVDSWRMENARKQVDAYYASQRPSGTFKGCATFRDWRELLARQDIDAVMISTPDHWHVPMAMAAAKAGKDIACEKPLTRSIAEGRQLADLVAREKRVFRTDSEFRSRVLPFNRAAQWVRNGKIGRLQTITVSTPKDTALPAQPAMPVPAELDYEMWLGPAPEAPYTEKRVHPRHDTKGRPGWMCIRDYADGMIANWGAHLFDIAMLANDTERTGPVEIQGRGQYPPPGSLWNVILDFEVEYRFANGVRLLAQADKPAIRFEGTEGWIQINYPDEVTVQPESLIRWKPGPNDVVLSAKSNEKRDFLDAVAARGTTRVDAEVGHRTLTLAHLGLLAIDLGRKLKWDPVTEQIIGDAEANQRLEPKPRRAPWTI